jgi:hypothetical protein
MGFIAAINRCRTYGLDASLGRAILYGRERSISEAGGRTLRGWDLNMRCALALPLPCERC